MGLLPEGKLRMRSPLLFCFTVDYIISLTEEQGLDSKASLHVSCSQLDSKIPKGSASEICVTKEQECPEVKCVDCLYKNKKDDGGCGPANPLT